MNGRVYDAEIGRFLQADPHIQAPTNSQNYNRYSYVLNNPMSYTDPTGYFFKKLKKFVKKYWRPILAAVAAVVTYGAATGWAASWGLVNTASISALGTTYTAVTGLSLGGYIAAGAIAGAASGFVATGSLKGAARGALSGAAFGGLGYGAHQLGWSNATQISAHALTGGVLSDLQGGNFGHGFFSAGIMKGIGKFNAAHIQNVYGGTVIQAIAGGTISRLTGGKFANGAVTAAIQFVVNEQSSNIQKGWKKFKSNFSRLKDELVNYVKNIYTVEQKLVAENCNAACVDTLGVVDNVASGVSIAAEYGSKIYKPAKGISKIADAVSTSAATTAAIAENKLGTELLSTGAGKIGGALSKDYEVSPLIEEAVSRGAEAMLEANK